MTAKRLSTKRARQTKQRVMLVSSLLFFLATTGFTMMNVFSAALNPADISTNQSTVEDPLVQDIKGYELVLQREPENQVALEGLVNARLQMDDIEGAIEPLEKLIALNPDRADYKALLTQLKEQG